MDREYYLKHCEHLKAKSREYYKNHREERRLYDKARYQDNRDKKLEQQREYNRTHRAERNRYLQKWRKSNPDKIRGYVKRWNKDHPEVTRKANSIWIKSHPEVRKVIDNRRRTRIAGGGGSHTVKEWVKLRDSTGGVCPCCQTYVGVKNLSEDHILPVSKGGSSNIDNIQPLCFVEPNYCNSKKYNKTIDYRGNIRG